METVKKFGILLDNFFPTRCAKLVMGLVLHMTNIERSKTLYHHQTLLSFTRAQKGYSYSSALQNYVCTCPTWRGAKHFNSVSSFLYSSCAHISHTFFYYTKAIDEMQTPKQLTNKYCIWSPSYWCIE